MERIVTVAERKAREASRRKTAAHGVMDDLRVYAARHGGRFLVFGSVASDRVRYSSDIDIMIDFPLEKERQAWSAVEEVCRAHGILGDLHSTSTSSTEFIERVRREAIVLE